QSLKDSFSDLLLADPNFHNASEIDVLLGVNVFLSLMKGETIKRDERLPFALSTKLGWVIAGSTAFPVENLEETSVSYLSVNTEELIQSFWEIEQIPTSSSFTKEENLCEKHFIENYARNDKGRYSVKLPFKAERQELGESKEFAFRQFLNLEKKLLKIPNVYQQYKDFMSEYLSLGHMEEVDENSVDVKNEHFYIPHHHVIKESSLTTRLRVVFNASAKSSSGVSLNDTLMIGTKNQDDLFAILLRFRSHSIAVTSDLQKMYRQINIENEDRNFQKILWRDNPSSPIKTYRLCTVTYGTASASYLATRVLKQLAIDESSNFPKASEVLLHNCYVDGVLFGADTSEESEKLIPELQELLCSGGFKLHKWCSNEKSVLERAIKTEDSKNSCEIIDAKSIKILGLEWEPALDEFYCNFEISYDGDLPTKRTILSSVSKIFDPLGWLAPFIIGAKILIQSLWTFQISWDDPVPEEINKKWTVFRDQLHHLKSIRIPRRVLLPNATKIELHAFCDASEKAYAAVIYLKSINDSSISVKLLTSKTRVAPLKTVSIPRLELCSALLLCHLVHEVRNSLKIQIDSTYAWTDSMIVLSWLQSESSRWKTFVANRVSEIQSVLPSEVWNHIRGKENPADCASRGILPSELKSHSLWWAGPSWLCENNIDYSNHHHFCEDALREERKKTTCAVGIVPLELSIIDKYSSFAKLLRIVAWCFRFLHNAKSPSNKTKGFLTTLEIKCARNALVFQIVQNQELASELNILRKGKPLNSKSKIISLSPFMDESGLIRVGGRLKNASISMDQKYPILLPKNHRLTEMIVRYFHEKYLHAGPTLLLSIIRKEYWITSARSIVRHIIWKCVKCFHQKGQTANQFMADLPRSRVQPSRVFSRVGTDYAGPFLIKPRRGRGTQRTKCYICVFVCFTTKAVHIEIVGDLTSEAFIAALKRFIGRRGKPTEIYSDCGTNFIAADRELRRVVASLRKDEPVNKFFMEESIGWKFNPPAAPHFGGLWEAAIKSAKLHLKRTIGKQILTYEEFLTLIIQIEACLNLRPLCPISEDPSELAVLTPGHFIIGTALTTIPEENLLDEKISNLKRWKLTQQLFQSFWKRWSSEYITSLQRRNKWQKPRQNVKLNDLVLLKDDNIPPLHWKLGRVTQVYPSGDDKVRVVLVKNANGLLKRPIHKLSVLPIEN
ncbi:hypothetical protein AVEN_19041-1, partial [Araneus ventricosus]